MKTIIFDFGRTLYDREVDRIFPEAFEVLEKLAAQYKMAIVSLDKRGDNRERLEVLKTNKIDITSIRLLLFRGIKILHMKMY